jgi:hypothetical protein
MNLSLNSNKTDQITVSIILLCLSVLFASCSTLRATQHPVPLPQARCLPSFPDQDGWYGADGAYSIRLDERRTLWVFGDTFVSEVEGRKDRIGMDVVMGTTLAISTCSENAAFKIRYYLKKKNGKFVSSLGDREILWPQDPFIAQGILHIPLLVIQSLPEAQPPFNFRIAGHKIARIKDYTADDPRAWPVEYLDWTSALPEGIEALATTSVVHQNHIYFYPLYRRAESNAIISGNILARIAIEHLGSPANHFEYWTAGGWQKELKAKEVKIIFPTGVSELSVRYHAEDREWLAVYLSPENKGNQLLYQTAPSPAGPFRPPAALIETIAEVDPQSLLYHPHTFCYAGKEHRQFAYDKNLVVTYVCNSSEDISNQQSFLRKNLFLYRPAVKTIKR